MRAQILRYLTNHKHFYVISKTSHNGFKVYLKDITATGAATTTTKITDAMYFQYTVVAKLYAGRHLRKSEEWKDFGHLTDEELYNEWVVDMARKYNQTISIEQMPYWGEYK